MATIHFSDRPENDQDYPSQQTYTASLTSKDSLSTTYKEYKGELKNDQGVPVNNLYTRKDVKKKLDRYRFLPKTRKDHTGKNTRSKIKWPVIYLGLSRVFPTGENSAATLKELNRDTENFVLREHKKILSEKYDIDESKASAVKGSESKKTGAGITTDAYGSLANSSGQDDIGQIILAVKSFALLKESLGENYIGGLLAIDEIDSTLHPAAQNMLFDFLIKKSEELNLQIVATSHSLSLIEYIDSKIKKGSKKEEATLVEIDPNVTSDGVEIINNPPYSRYKNVLSRQLGQLTPSRPKVKLLTEDNTARWFFNKLLTKSGLDLNNARELDPLNISMGWSNLVTLISSDVPYYDHFMIFFDPDVTKEDFVEISPSTYETFGFNSEEGKSNIYSLPGKCEQIESIMVDFIIKDEVEKHLNFWNDQRLRDHNINQALLKEKIRQKYNTDLDSFFKDKKNHKKWFAQNPDIVEIAIDYYIAEDSKEINKWLKTIDTATKNIKNKISI